MKKYFLFIYIFVFSFGLVSISAFDNKTYFNSKQQDVSHYHWIVSPFIASDWAYTYGFNKYNFIPAMGLDTKWMREAKGNEISFFLRIRNSFYDPFSTFDSDYKTHSFFWSGYNTSISFHLFKPIKLFDGMYFSTMIPSLGFGGGNMFRIFILKSNVNNQKFWSDFGMFYSYGLVSLGTDIVIVRNMMDVNVDIDVLFGSLRIGDGDPLEFFNFNLDSMFYTTMNLSIGVNFYLF